MAYQRWIADALRTEGLQVNEIPDWKTRGTWRTAGLRPRGVIGHHTAGSLKGDHPSLQVVIDGRKGLPGPLCQVLIDRKGICHVVAAGYANHAGKGAWRDIKSSYNMLGIEVEHNGTTEEWRPEILVVFDKAAAALLRGINATAANYCGHKEWALPAGRKIDPVRLDMNDQRARIDALLRGLDPSTVEPVPSTWDEARLMFTNKAQEVLIEHGYLTTQPTPDGKPGTNTLAALDRLEADLRNVAALRAVTTDLRTVAGDLNNIVQEIA